MSHAIVDVLPADAPDWAREAYRLVREDGLSQNAAAAKVGKDRMSVAYWILEGEAGRQKAKARDWRRANPERVRELARKGGRKRRREKGEEVRAYARLYGRRLDRRGTCSDCGAAMGIDNPKDGVCMRCRRRTAEEKRKRIVRLWKEGSTMKEIAQDLGTSANVLGVEMAAMRKAGYDLPLRRRSKATA